MKILTNFPYSPFGRSAGSTQRFNQIILGLRELGHEIRLWSFKNPSGYIWDQAALDRSRQLGIEVCLTERGKFETSLLEGIDAIWGIYFHYMRFFELFEGPKVCDSHDILTPNFSIDKYFGHFLSKEGEIFAFDREVFNEPFIQDFPVEECELEVYRKYHPIMISLREQRILAQKGIRSTYIPFLPSLPEEISDHSGLPCFLASAHLNNLFANDLLGTTILPRIRLSAPDFEVNTIGEIDTICRHFPAINYLGYTEDNTALKSARFGLFPSPFGTGFQLKLLTYMAYGFAPVVFERRAELPLINNENCLAVSSIAEFSEACVGLWKDPVRCRKMGDNARQSIESFYSKDRMLQDLQRIIDDQFLDINVQS